MIKMMKAFQANGENLKIESWIFLKGSQSKKHSDEIRIN